MCAELGHVWPLVQPNRNFYRVKMGKRIFLGAHSNKQSYLCALSVGRWEEMYMSTKGNLARQLNHLSVIWISPGELSGDAQDNNTKGSLTSLQTFQRRYSFQAKCSPVSFGLKTHAGTHMHADPYTDPNTRTHACARCSGLISLTPHQLAPANVKRKPSQFTDSEWVGVNESKFPSVTFAYAGDYLN